MTDLTDYGGGVERDDPNPEDDINRYLSSWLRGDDRRVYWDRNKSYGNGTFSVSTRRRPDLVIQSKKRNYAVEVKDAEDSANVHDGTAQVFDYWRDLTDGEAQYSVNGQSIEIHAVLLATQHAPEGRLFHNWNNKDPLRSGRSEGAQKAAQFGQIPDIEHSTSESVIRILHRFAKQYDADSDIGIGGLLSSALDGDHGHHDTADPATLFYAPGWSTADGKLVQNWEHIPWYLDD
jgi:hypothetical protein